MAYVVPGVGAASTPLAETLGETEADADADADEEAPAASRQEVSLLFPIVICIQNQRSVSLTRRERDAPFCSKPHHHPHPPKRARLECRQ